MRALRRPAKGCALLLILALLAGCMRSSPPLDVPAPDGQRADLAYSQMQYQRGSYEDFAVLAGRVADFARTGGAQADFDQARAEAERALEWLYTMASLAELRYCAQPRDETLSQERLRAQELCYEAWDCYFAALGAVADSPYSRLLGAQADVFAAAGEDARSLELSRRELELQAEYEQLICAPEPDYDAILALYVELVGLRQELAACSGYDCYADYAYETVYYRSYTPEQARTLWQTAKQDFVPLLAEYGPAIWAASDLFYAAPVIDTAPQTLLDALGSGLREQLPELLEPYEYLLRYGLYDIAPDGQKLQMGYTVLLYAYNEPFLYNAPGGTFYDYTDLFHEFGHFANYYFCGSDLLYGLPDNDLSELQSQGLEALLLPCYESFFSAAGGVIAADVLLGLAECVVEGAMYDEFQQRVYAEPELSEQRVRQIFDQVYRSYGYEPYEGYEAEWLGQLHNFEYPFYYISYSVSAIPALELYTLLSDEPERAREAYLTLVRLDCEQSDFRQALALAGLSDVFDAAACRSIAEALVDGVFS